jgi:hypothetical protein
MKTLEQQQKLPSQIKTIALQGVNEDAPPQSTAWLRILVAFARRSGALPPVLSRKRRC